MADPTVPPPPEGFTIDAPVAPTPVEPIIGRTPAPQTPAQAQKDQGEADTATNNATISGFKVKEEGLTEGKQQAQKDMTTAGVDNLVSSIESAKKLVNGWSTGVVGQALHHIGGTEAAQLKSIIDQEIKGNVFLTTLQQRQQDSPNNTGSTPGGRILQSEVPMITGALGTLDPSALGDTLTTEKLNQIAYRALRAKAIINGDDPNDPAVQKKYGIDKYAAVLPSTDISGATPSGPNDAATTPPAPNPGGNTPGSTPPAGPTNLSPVQKQAYDAFLAANPNPTGDQVGKFLSHLTGRQVKNGDDIAKAIGEGRGVSSAISDFGANLKNDVAGVVQGAAQLPDMAATAVGKVASVVPTAVGYGLDKLGFSGAGDYARGIAHDLANPAQIGNGVESIAPTPNTTSGKVNRFIGTMVGGAAAFPSSAAERLVSRFVGDVPKGFSTPVSSAAGEGQTPAETATALQAEGIPAARPIADPSVRAKMAYLETTPGGNNIVRDSLDQTRRSIADKVASVAGDGTVQTPGAMGETVQNAGKRTLQNMKDAASGVYTQADQASQGAPIHPTEALAKLDGYIAQLSRNPETNSGVLSYLQGVRNDLAAPSGKTVGDIRDIITGANDKINFQNLQKTRAEGIMADVKSGLNTDVSRDLGSANPQALALYQKADGMWSDMSNLRQQVVNKLIGPANNPISGEQALGRVTNMMNNKGDLGRFQRVTNMMTPEEKSDFAATLFGSIGQRSAEEPFSPAYFLSQTKNMQPDALKTVFGEDGATSIQNLRVASQGFKEATGSLNNSRSGQVTNWKNAVGAIVNLKSTLGGTAGYAVGGVPGAVAGAVALPAITNAAEKAFTGLSAKALMNPDVSSWIRQVAQVKTEQGARSLIGKLNGIGAANAAVQGEITSLSNELTKAANDNFGRTGSAAASPDQRPNQKQ